MHNQHQYDVSQRPAFHALKVDHHTCNHTPAEILRMVDANVKQFSNEQLAAVLIVLEQEHKCRMAMCEH